MPIGIKIINLHQELKSFRVLTFGGGDLNGNWLFVVVFFGLGLLASVGVLQ